MNSGLFLPVSLVIAGAVIACTGDTVPVPLQATPAGRGPTVIFDVTQRPFPNIPLPNDVATFPDPTSRTGLRINASLVASTNMEQVTRVGFDQMEGWGTYAPISVAFTRPADVDPHAAAINLEDVATRFRADAFDFANDPVYLVNLTTGVPVPLDMGNGNFPASVSDPTAYFPNDVKGVTSPGNPLAVTENVQNILFETYEEGAGLLQSDYKPSLDQDMDGILDHPNVLGSQGIPGVDNLLTWYERESDTLILRPLLPLEEKTEYAVVLTDRLVGYDGQPVRSPFAQVYHAAQLNGATQTLAAMNNSNHATYFGDIAGTGLQHVAFLWTFTTQPTQEDMRLLRNGLYGQGPFARFATDYPPAVKLFPAAGLTADAADESAGWQDTPLCKEVAKHPYTLFITPFLPTLNTFYTQIFGYSASDATLLGQEMANVDHVVIGTYETPFLMGDPASPDPDTQFNLNFVTGEGTVNTDQVHFYIFVPKETSKFRQPFPVTFWEHGVTGADDEAFIYAGNFAKQGIATIAIDLPEHGRYVPASEAKAADLLLSGSCVAPLINAIGSGRDHDLNGDGIPDSGGLFWTAHVFHTRDVVRQGTLDMMNAVRILRSFVGSAKAGQDYNGNGDPNDDLAGDFDGNGTPDLGGPDQKYFGAGESLGGIMSEIIGGIDPYISATSPVSGGGGGANDIAVRSYGENAAVMLEVMSPLVLAMPSSDRPPVSGVNQTNCGPTQTSVRFYVNNLTGAQEIEIACLNPDEIGPNMTVLVTDTTSGQVRCGRTIDAEGRLRVPIPATIGDSVSIQIYPEPDAVDSYKTCNVPASAAKGRVINTWEQAASSPYLPEANPKTVCPGQAAGAPNKCQQFFGVFYPVGGTLIMPQEGLAYLRNTPDLRRLMNLVQAAFDPADPINYAPYYMMRPNIGVNGETLPPRALLAVSTVGDGFVNISTGTAFARAAGTVPFLPPTALDIYPDYADYVAPAALFDQWGTPGNGTGSGVTGQSANDLLITNFEVEGISRFARTPAGRTCGVNYETTIQGYMCNMLPAIDPTSCHQALYDADWFAEGLDQYDQQHAPIPMRAARDSTLHPINPATLALTWEARIRGTPFTPDTVSPALHPLIAVANVYMQPTGQHSYDAGNPCEAFDTASYMQNTVARFFATGGTDLYYLSHPTSHKCMENRTCPFLLP
jgi:hypothetical protein